MRSRLVVLLFIVLALALMLPRPRTQAAWSHHVEAEAGVLCAPMSTGWSADASACGYVTSALHEEGAVTFTVTVPTSADYWLWGRGMGLALYQNSFWVSVDGSTPIKYEIPQFGGAWCFGWEVVHPAHEPVVPYYLSSGEHTLEFAAREANARLDAIWLCDDAGQSPPDPSPCGESPTPSHTPSTTPTVTLTPVSSPTPTATATPQPTVAAAALVWAIEAESGAIEAPVVAIADSQASAGACIHAPVHEGGAVSYQVQIEVSGAYYMWARVQGQALNHNSFWVSVDGDGPIKYEIPTFGGEWVWGWEVVHPAHEPVVPYALGVGPHTIRFAARESDARLDALLLTADAGFQPVGVLGDLGLTPTPTVTATPSRTATATRTITPTRTTTATSTASATQTATRTGSTTTPTATSTPTLTGTATRTTVAAATTTATPSATANPTSALGQTATLTPTPSPTPSATLDLPPTRKPGFSLWLPLVVRWH